MGQELTTAMGLNFPGRGWEESQDNHPIAGEYDAVGLDMQGISTSQLTAVQTRIEATKAVLAQDQPDTADTTSIAGLTKEDLSGDLLYAGILGYFATVDGNDQLAARAENQVVSYRLPSYGIFQAAAQPSYWFGIARSVTFPGVVMDVDRISYLVEARDAEQKKRISYMKQVGSAESSLENAVPQRMFADPNLPANDPSQPRGVSAAEAIAIAANQGQKIYTLNAQNQAYHASIINGLNVSADVKVEITNALAAGKEVTVPQSEITVNGWTGSGYVITDPDTGAGAYKIAGGANGGWLSVLAAGLSGLVDALLTKLRDPNSFFGPYAEIRRSYFIGLAAKATALLSFVTNIIKIVTNPSLTVTQQVAEIVAALTFTVAAGVGAAAIGGFFAVPAAGAILAVVFTVALAFINEWVNEQIALYL